MVVAEVEPADGLHRQVHDVACIRASSDDERRQVALIGQIMVEMTIPHR